MEDVCAMHRRAGDLAYEVISRVPVDRMNDPTPCTEWNVRAVVNHMVNGNLRFVATITGRPGPERGDKVLGEDPLADFRETFDLLCAAFDRPGVLERTYPSPFGDQPAAVLAGMRTGDTTLHAWDLSAATGQPRDLEPELVVFVDTMMRSVAPPRRAGGPFGPERQAPPGACAADRLAAFMGREVPAPAV